MVCYHVEKSDELLVSDSVSLTSGQPLYIYWATLHFPTVLGYVTAPYRVFCGPDARGFVGSRGILRVEGWVLNN